MNALSIFSTAWLTKLASLFGKTKWQVKTLASNFTGNGNITGLGINTLVVGKTYGLKLHVSRLGTSSSYLMQVSNGGQALGQVEQRPASVGIAYPGLVTVFIAESTSLTFTMSSHDVGEAVVGDGTRNGTHFILEELPNHSLSLDLF